MAKAPAFQFYPQDWLSDANVKRLSWGAKGVYAELLALMWNEQEDRLPDDEDLPKILGITEAEWRAFRDEFQNKLNKKQRVFVESNGYLVSRRLKKERRKQRHTRRVRQEAARCKWKAFADAKRCSSSSTSSSASASAKKKKKQPLSPGGDGYSPGFQKWWAAYPSGQRKRGKPKCWAKWKREKLEARANDIIACLAAAKKSRDWKKERGQYIPGPHPWLNDAPWLTENFAKDAADGPVPSFVPQMGADTPEDRQERAWSYELTAAQRQEWFARAEKEMPGQPKPLIWAKARKLWEQDRLRAGKEH